MTIDEAAIPYAWMRQELSFDGELSRGRKGAKVALVQEWLCFHGNALCVDGDFGPATEKAVRAFQRGSGLAESGAIDRATFRELVLPMLRTLTPPASALADLGSTVVACAKQHLAEHPREIGGENSGPWVRLYTRGFQGRNYPWCAGFVSFIVRQAADVMKMAPPLTYTLSCDALADEARQRGRFLAEGKLGGATPPPGTLFLCRQNPGDWTHTGLVVGGDAQTFETIEGNTNDAGEREGYEVCLRMRGYKSKDFIIIS